MRTFFEWYSAHANQSTPWLILGKGPSFAKREQYDLSDYYTLSLNHAVREQLVFMAHLIDFDVVEQCGEALDTNACYVVMPWVPHIRCRARGLTLRDLLPDSPMLRKLDADGRLLYYNLRTGQYPRGLSPIVPVRYFSAEAALNLLAMAGVKTIRSLGIDGRGAVQPGIP